MADVVNLYAESDRNIIGDDSTPTLELENTSSGHCLQLQNAGGTGIALSIISCPTTAINIANGGLAVSGSVAFTGNLAVTGNSVLRSTASASNVLNVGHQTALSSATVAPFSVFTSTPSGPLMQFAAVDKGVVSTASGCVTVSYGVRVKVGDTYGWIYVYPTLA